MSIDGVVFEVVWEGLNEKFVEDVVVIDFKVVFNFFVILVG